VAGKQQDWIKWYFSHWSADAGVRSVSLEARGLWIDMLALISRGVRGDLFCLDLCIRESQKRSHSGARNFSRRFWIGWNTNPGAAKTIRERRSRHS
jgi:hypothetical protein